MYMFDRYVLYLQNKMHNNVLYLQTTLSVLCESQGTSQSNVLCLRGFRRNLPPRRFLSSSPDHRLVEQCLQGEMKRSLMYQGPVADVKSCPSLCCVAVRLPRHVIGNCGVTLTVWWPKSWSNSRDKAAAKLSGGHACRRRLAAIADACTRVIVKQSCCILTKDSPQ